MLFKIYIFTVNEQPPTITRIKNYFIQEIYFKRKKAFHWFISKKCADTIAMIGRCLSNGTMKQSFSSLLHVLVWLKHQELCRVNTVCLGFYILLQELVNILLIVNKLSVKHRTLVLARPTPNQEILYVSKTRKKF